MPSSERNPRAQRNGRGNLRLVFYGDDFTGSTDSLESLVSAGLRAVLFLRPPDRALLERRFPGVEAIGVAGDARSLPPDAMREQLPHIFQAIANLGPDVMHYKVCSTYDSAPHVGNIAVASQLLLDALRAPAALALGGAPHLGRYLAFGHLFARHGHEGRVYRIDRHPVMRAHPTTPMTESDLREHLRRQSDQVEIQHVSLPELHTPDADTRLESAIGPSRGSDPRLVLVDAVHPDDVRVFANGIDRLSRNASTIAVVGPSSVEAALGNLWGGADPGAQTGVKAGLGAGVLPQEPTIAATDRILVLSGSCSSVTRAQAERASQAGFTMLSVSPGELGEQAGMTANVDKVARALDDAPAVMVATCSDPSAPANGPVSPGQIGELFSRLIELAVAEYDLRRIVIAGGDTSSQTMRRLPVTALEMVGRLSPGVPLCRVDAEGTKLNGIEVALKGGQLGGSDIFIEAWRGTRP